MYTSALVCLIASVAVYLFIVPATNASVITSYEECPDPSDPCMNNDSFNECLDLIDSGCDEITVVPSCPLQFVCHVVEEQQQSPLDNEDDNFDSCVSLYVYETTRCTGEPIREMTFSTWSKPGSPCYHDALMINFSVKDQYCDETTGHWHETVFLGSEKCNADRWWGDSPLDLTFTSEGCVGGMRLKECRFSPCPSVTSEYSWQNKRKNDPNKKQAGSKQRNNKKDIMPLSGGIIKVPTISLHA